MVTRVSAATPLLSNDQKFALRSIKQWCHDSGGPQHFALGGLAGTGKTTVLSRSGRVIGVGKVAYCAPTNAATRVLEDKLIDNGSLRPTDTVTTIHRLIYQPMEYHCRECPSRTDGRVGCHGEYGQCGCGTQWNFTPSARPDLIAVDEASMVNEAVYKDLMACGVKVLFVGDHGQLPPIDGNLSIMAAPTFALEKIHRQAEKSPIIRLAHEVRQTGSIPDGVYGPGVHKTRRWGKLKFPYEEGALVIASQNWERVEVNTCIRRRLGLPSYPVVGDRVVSLANRPKKGIYNGARGTITGITRTKAVHLLRVRLDDGDEYSGRALVEQFDRQYTMTGVSRDYDLWDYGYCITAHKAQGSEADKVIVIERKPGPMTDDDWRRWLYTAVTRARSELTVLGCRS